MALMAYSTFYYHDFLSLKAHLSLDEFLIDMTNREAASRTYYYLEVCWLAASTCFKNCPVKLLDGRENLAKIIKGNSEIISRNDITEVLNLAISCADGVAKRIGREKIIAAQKLLSEKIDSALQNEKIKSTD